MRAEPEIVRRVDYYEREDCYLCDCKIDQSQPRLFIPWYEMKKRGALVTFAPQVCATCFRTQEAINDARLDGRRFTALSHSPCDCGGFALDALSECMACWREGRMLEKKQAEVRFNTRLIQTLKRNANGDQDRRAA